MRLKITVEGKPATQGSMRGFVVAKAGCKPRAIVTADSKKLKPWRTLVHDACQKAIAAHTASGKPGGTHSFPLRSAVYVCVEIILPRLALHPKTDKGKKPGPPIGKGDLDKHQRAIGDALTTSGVLQDDGLICEWHASKRYADLGEAAGAIIEVVLL